MAIPKAAKASESLQAIITEPFTGHDRALAKEIVAKGAPQGYKDLKALLKALPSDQAMLKLKPRLTVRSARIKEEDKNVTVADCWIYAVKHETDNDFHVILGSAATAGASDFMNAEICGIPKTGPWVTTLEHVRQVFVSLLGLQEIQLTYKGFVKITPPLRVKVEGSIFYDVDHPPGAVGPTGMKPKTSWEIHPITAI